jgi:hypothetical protein
MDGALQRQEVVKVTPRRAPADDLPDTTDGTLCWNVGSTHDCAGLADADAAFRYAAARRGQLAGNLGVLLEALSNCLPAHNMPQLPRQQQQGSKWASTTKLLRGRQ